MIVGLDIGTTKVCAIIGERNEDGLLEITGFGESPSLGMRRGIIVNIESMMRSVLQAIEAAELMSGREVHSCWTGIGGTSVRGMISKGVVAVNGNRHNQREISGADVERVLKTAQDLVDIPIDREVLDVITQSFKVDSQSGIRNPLGMIGIRLESEVHIISCSRTTSENIIRCVNLDSFTVKGLVLQSLAAGTAVLTDEEKDLGVALIDMGGGTTNALVYINGMPHDTFSVPANGFQVTNDISQVKNVAVGTAEKLKREAGCCWAPLLDRAEEGIVVPGIGGRAPFPVTRLELLEIIEPRMRETFNLIKEQLNALPSAHHLGGGIVLTGGGAKLLGAADLAAKIFNVPVRIGEPFILGGLAGDYRSPEYATAIGLVLEGDMRERQAAFGSVENTSRESGRPGPISRFVHWVRHEFF